MTDQNRVENSRLEMEDARTALAAARALCRLGLWKDAVSRAYYAAFHAATAALYSLGLQARRHSGTHYLFYQSFVENGPLARSVAGDLSELRKHREEADYKTAAVFDEKSGAEDLARAERFVSEVEALLRSRGILPQP